MTIIEECKQLRGEILKLRPDNRRRYSKDLRHRILDWLERSRDAGIDDNAGSKLLGVRVHRFTMWREYEQKRATREAAEGLDGGEAHEPLALVPVESPLLTSAVTLRTPTGYCVTGLSIAELVMVLREVA